MGKLFTFLRRSCRERAYCPPGHSIFGTLGLASCDSAGIMVVNRSPCRNVKRTRKLYFSIGSNIVPPPSLGGVFRRLGGSINEPVARDKGLAT